MWKSLHRLNCLGDLMGTWTPWNNRKWWHTCDNMWLVDSINHGKEACKRKHNIRNRFTVCPHKKCITRNLARGIFSPMINASLACITQPHNVGPRTKNIGRTDEEFILKYPPEDSRRRCMNIIFLHEGGRGRVKQCWQLRSLHQKVPNRDPNGTHFFKYRYQIWTTEQREQRDHRENRLIVQLRN